MFGWSLISGPVGHTGGTWVRGAGGEVFRPLLFDSEASTEAVLADRNYWIEPLHPEDLDKYGKSRIVLKRSPR